MAYDEALADRIRKALKGTKGVVEKHMFGGVAFLLNGNMCVGVHKDEMIVRLDAAETESALAEKATRVFDLSGRPMKGWILVGPAGIRTVAGLSRWIDRGRLFASSLPKKNK
jgi:hypothetical protein